MWRFIAVCAFAAGLASASAADPRPVVVELFTSQGCSSCPPADEMMHELSAQDDVIALALHVDYWDYIGWKDEFADPRNAERQRAYARKGRRRSIYTPEFVIGGTTDIVGAKPMPVMEAIAAHQAIPAVIELSIARKGDRVTIDARPLAAFSGGVEIHLLRYHRLRNSRITRGENAGRDFAYVNVTEDWRMIGSWDGAAPLHMEARAPGDLPVVVLLQEAGAGRILAAARLR